MTEFANLSEVLNRLSGGNSGNPEALFYNKETRFRSSGTAFSRAAGKSYSLWLSDGGNPGSGVAPTGAAVPTSATRGALAFTNASGGRDKRLVCMTASAPGTSPNIATSIHNLGLYDRLFHIGNLDGTSASVQNVQSGAGVPLTRHTSGVGNEIWLEVYTTALGGTDRTATCSYTNQAGTSGRTTRPLPVAGSNHGVGAVTEFAKFQLQAGDTGVQSVETCTLSGSTGVAGVWGITIVNRIAVVPLSESYGIYDFTYSEAGTYIIEDNACLAFAGHFAATNDLAIAGILTTAER